MVGASWVVMSWSMLSGVFLTVIVFSSAVYANIFVIFYLTFGVIKRNSHIGFASLIQCELLQF